MASTFLEAESACRNDITKAEATRRTAIGALMLAPFAAAAAVSVPTTGAARAAWDRLMAAHHAASLRYREAWDRAAAAPIGQHASIEDEADRHFLDMSQHLDALVKLPAPTMRDYAERLQMVLVDGEIVEWHAPYIIADACRLGGLA